MRWSRVGRKCKRQLLGYAKKIAIIINFDDVRKENRQKHNSHWLLLPDHRYRILTVGSSGSGKIIVLHNLINHQPDIYKTYLYAKYVYEPKYQILIIKCEEVGLTQILK